MKLLYICSADLSGITGSMGSVRHIMEVAENLCLLGCRVRLLAPKYARYSHPTPVRITYVPLIKIRFLRTLIPELLAPIYIIFLLLFFRPAVVYWRQSYLTIFPVLLCKIFGKRIITEINGLTLDEIESERLSTLRKTVIKRIESFNYRNSSFLICVAPQIRSRIIEAYKLDPARCSVILNGVNADRMRPIEKVHARQEIKIDPSAAVIGFVGHLFPWDGVEYLIEAAPAVIRAVPNVLFLIVGHGQWGTHLAELVANNKLADRFVFTGKVDWEKLYLYVNAFDVATAPYCQKINIDSGRSSLKILEYFACKKPVIATRTGAIPEILDIEERNLGLVVPPENAQALAEALITLLTDPELRTKMGAGGREYVLSQRSWRRVAQQTLLILEGAIR